MQMKIRQEHNEDPIISECHVSVYIFAWTLGKDTLLFLFHQVIITDIKSKSSVPVGVQRQKICSKECLTTFGDITLYNDFKRQSPNVTNLEIFWRYFKFKMYRFCFVKGYTYAGNSTSEQSLMRLFSKSECQLFLYPIIGLYLKCNFHLKYDGNFGLFFLIKHMVVLQNS